MVSEWVAGGLFLLGSLWAVPAWHLGKANGINHATWRTKQVMYDSMKVGCDKHERCLLTNPAESCRG